MHRKDREVTEFAQIEEILEKGKVVHLGMIDGDFPYKLWLSMAKGTTYFVYAWG